MWPFFLLVCGPDVVVVKCWNGLYFGVELPVQRRICSIFVKSRVLEKGDSMDFTHICVHDMRQIFRRLMVVNGTPEIGVSHLEFAGPITGKYREK